MHGYETLEKRIVLRWQSDQTEELMANMIETKTKVKNNSLL